MPDTATAPESAPAPASTALTPELASPAPSADTTRETVDPMADAESGVSTLPEAQTWLVVLADHHELGLARGEVIGTTYKTAKPLKADGLARPATDAEIELAQPRVRLWTKG